MSDYLSHLAARSLDPVPAVRPRLASRFEPRPPAISPLTANPAAEPALVEEAVEVRAEPPRPRRSQRRVVPAQEPEQEPVAGAELATLRKALPEAIAPARLASRKGLPFETSPPVPLSVAGEGERSRPVPAVQPAALGTTLRISPPSPVLLERGSGGEVSRGDRSIQAQPSAALHPALSASAPSPHQPSSRESISSAPPVSSPLAARETPPREGASHAAHDLPAKRLPIEERWAAPPLQPQITVVERTPLPVRAETPAAEPVIQITIGRIEVRATPPPQQPARPRPATPTAPSLEEYLRRRSRRGDG